MERFKEAMRDKFREGRGGNLRALARTGTLAHGIDANGVSHTSEGRQPWVMPKRV